MEFFLYQKNLIENFETEAKGARPVQDGVQTIKTHGIQNGYYFMYGTQIVSVLLR